MRKVTLVLAAAGLMFFGLVGSANADNHLPGQSVLPPGTGGLEGPAVGRIGNPPATCAPVLDLPAISVGEDCIDMPGMIIGGPTAPVVTPVPATPTPHVHVKPAHRHAPKRLPVTGVNIGDFLAFGMAALAGGGVFLRRLRMIFGA